MEKGKRNCNRQRKHVREDSPMKLKPFNVSRTMHCVLSDPSIQPSIYLSIHAAGVVHLFIHRSNVLVVVYGCRSHSCRHSYYPSDTSRSSCVILSPLALPHILPFHREHHKTMYELSHEIRYCLLFVVV